MSSPAHVPVGPENDAAEREASAIAQQITQDPVPTRALPNCPLCTSAAATAPCPTCGAAHNVMRRSAAASGPASASERWASSGAGIALPAPQRAYFERRLGADLGGVRIHNHASAGAAARSAGAHAMTLGNHIAFAPAAYQPDTPSGSARSGRSALQPRQNLCKVGSADPASAPAVSGLTQIGISQSCH